MIQYSTVYIHTYTVPISFSVPNETIFTRKTHLGSRSATILWYISYHTNTVEVDHWSFESVSQILEFLESSFVYLHARGGSTAAAPTSFFERSIQLSTTGIFCRFCKKCCTIKYYVRKIRILGKHEIQYLIVLYFKKKSTKNTSST